MNRDSVDGSAYIPPAARIAGTEECRARVDGIDIRFLKAGSGTPIVLIHGLLGFSYSWRFNFQELAKIGTVYAPDLPGTGYSGRNTGDCSLAGLASVMLKWMEQLGIQHASLVGTSHGGAVTMVMAALDRDKEVPCVAKHVLVAPVNPYSRGGQRRIAILSSPIGSFFLLRSTPILKATRAFFLARVYGDSSRIAPGTAETYAAPLGIAGTLPHLLRVMKCWSTDVESLHSILPRIADIPTLLVWGTLDTAVYPSSARKLQERLRNSKLVLMDGVGHLPYEECPDEFNRILVGWLSEQQK